MNRTQNRNGLTRQILLSALLLLPCSLTFAAPESFNKGMQEFIDQMVSRHGFERENLSTLMQQAKYRQSIIDAISRPAEGKPWHQYRPIFVTESRTKQGVEFWNGNRELLERAEETYGVPAEIIVAIIGVETRYGRHAGRYPVLDALATLGFSYPKRSAFFRRQLEELLLLAREEKIDPVTLVGSYAGAMGKPQFIPSSYRAYAVDFDGDGQRDLLNNNADVIGSVAAYFKRHGWRKGEPVAAPAQGVGKAHGHYLKAGMKPSIPLGQLEKAGITSKLEAKPAELASLIRLRQKSGNEYWIGLGNFYVITRYNHSNLYAMAVLQLSRKIRQAYDNQG